MNATEDILKPEWERAKRRRSLALLVAAVAVLIPLVLFLNYYFSGSTATEELIARIKQRGEPLTSAEVAARLPRVPDRENGALLLLAAWGLDAPARWQAFREGGKPVDGPSVKYDRGLPFLGADLENVPRTVVLDPTNTAAAEEYLAAREEHLAAIRAALRHKQFRFPAQITNGVSAWLPHLGELRLEAENFRIAGLMALEHGDVAGAIDAMEDTARAGRALANEPFLLSQLVRVGCYAMVLADLERLLTWKAVAPDQLDQLGVLLGDMQAAGALRQALIAERTAYLDAMDRPANWMSQVTQEGDSVSVEFRVAAGALSVSGIMDADRRMLLQTLEQAIELAGHGDPEALQRLEDLVENAERESHKFPPKIFTGSMLPSARAVSRFGRYEARRRAARVALAVERYRLAHEGRLPEQLDELAPQFPSGIPLDPFDGQLIRFRALPVGYVVYSVGCDRVDDGGLERPASSSKSGRDETFIVER